MQQRGPATWPSRAARAAPRLLPWMRSCFTVTSPLCTTERMGSEGTKREASAVPRPTCSHGAVELKRRFALTAAMLLHRVEHKVKACARLEQRVHTRLRVLWVAVVIIRAMDEYASSVPITGACDERGPCIPCRMFGWRLQDGRSPLRVRVAPVSDRCARHTSFACR